MDTCDVVIAGGGPAGAACAWRLREAGLDVIVIDKAVFPRDKVCAGWITPPVVADLAIDPDVYRRGRTWQPMTAFRVGRIGAETMVDVRYDEAVSFGIRRCEFDDYLLRRSRARLVLGVPVSAIRRSAEGWIVNGTIAAPMLVGAGGHGCPVARLLHGAAAEAPLVAAQEVEVPVDGADGTATTVEPGSAFLYFCPDLKGYGWCVRKENYLNVGLGRIDARALPEACAAFAAFLQAHGVVTPTAAWHWRGHAYRLSGPARREAVADGAVLVGDAAGLACPQSGEGIRPAIESGLLAAQTIVDAAGQYTRARLAAYELRLDARFGVRSYAQTWGRALPGAFTAAAATHALASPWFVRHVVLDRWFLHAHESPLAAAVRLDRSVPASRHLRRPS